MSKRTTRRSYYFEISKCAEITLISAKTGSYEVLKSCQT